MEAVRSHTHHQPVIDQEVSSCCRPRDTGRFTQVSRGASLAAEFDIDCIHVNLAHSFSDTTPITHSISWPSECFWWLCGHVVFTQYRFSCQVDGDVLCINPLPHDDCLPFDHHIAGVSKSDGSLNTGVIFCNNPRLTDFDFFARIRDFHRTTKACDHDEYDIQCRQHSDQELLDRFMTHHPEMTCLNLPSSYNYLLPNFLHLLAKPWKTRRPDYRQATEGSHLCLDHVRQLWGDRRAREIFPDAFGNPRRTNATASEIPPSRA